MDAYIVLCSSDPDQFMKVSGVQIILSKMLCKFLSLSLSLSSSFPSCLLSILQSCAEVIVQGCQYYVCDVKPEGVVTIVNVMARVVQVYPNHFPHIIRDFLATIIKNLLKEEVCLCHCTCN